MMSSNGIVGPLLTDLYQLRMAYVYWKVDLNEEYGVNLTHFYRLEMLKRMLPFTFSSERTHSRGSSQYLLDCPSAWRSLTASISQSPTLFT